LPIPQAGMPKQGSDDVIFAGLSMLKTMAYHAVVVEDSRPARVLWPDASYSASSCGQPNASQHVDIAGVLQDLLGDAAGLCVAHLSNSYSSSMPWRAVIPAKAVSNLLLHDTRAHSLEDPQTCLGSAPASKGNGEHRVADMGQFIAVHAWLRHMCHGAST
jgi:hypothetical protein